jgi:BMFP domain-containing protein YqiC
MVVEISDRLRDRFNTAKTQLEEVQDRVVHSFGDVRGQVNEVPKELRGAWDRVLTRLWAALDVPSREDFVALTRRVDAIDRKLAKLVKKAPAKRTRRS